MFGLRYSHGVVTGEATSLEKLLQELIRRWDTRTWRDIYHLI